ncbi:MAG: DUF805 domain-containing protein [Candidatus Azobacteroides sp.]|nr:DUF805 domain-containing protein [Candidatus Azobacteroides sp.]
MKWFIKCLKNYAYFSGRARRKEYWMFALFSIIFLFVWLVLISGLSIGLGKQGQQSAITIAWWAYILALLMPSLAVGVRRLHDIGKSSWWMLLALIPFIGWLVLFIFFVINSEWGSNKYGDNPKGMENNSNNLSKPLSTPVVAKQNIYQTTNNNSDYSTIENTVDNDLFGLMPEDFGRTFDEALFFEWKESVKKFNKLFWIQIGLYAIALIPGILFGIIVRRKQDKKVLNLQIRLGITNNDIKQARVNCKNRIKMRRLFLKKSQQSENKGMDSKSTISSKPKSAKVSSILTSEEINAVINWLDTYKLLYGRVASEGQEFMNKGTAQSASDMFNTLGNFFSNREKLYDIKTWENIQKLLMSIQNSLPEVLSEQIKPMTSKINEFLVK